MDETRFSYESSLEFGTPVGRLGLSDDAPADNRVDGTSLDDVIGALEEAEGRTDVLMSAVEKALLVVARSVRDR